MFHVYLCYAVILQPCGNLLGKGWPLGSLSWVLCFLKFLSLSHIEFRVSYHMVLDRICNWVGWFEPFMVGNPEDRSSRWGPDNFCDPVSFPQIAYCFFLLIINVSSDKVCFKRFDFTYIGASWACVITICIPLWIYESRLLFQFSPRLFGSPNVHSTLRILSKEVFSRRGWQLLGWSERSNVMPT